MGQLVILTLGWILVVPAIFLAFQPLAYELYFAAGKQEILYLTPLGWIYLLVFFSYRRLVLPEVQDAFEALRIRRAQRRYEMTHTDAEKSRDWWLNRYPDKRAVAQLRFGGVHCTQDPEFNEWREMLERLGYGPARAEIPAERAQVVHSMVLERFVTSDARLCQISDVDELSEKFETNEELSSFQCWELDGKLIELRKGKSGFIFEDGNWKRFEDLGALVKKGESISYRDLYQRLRGAKPLTDPRGFSHYVVLRNVRCDKVANYQIRIYDNFQFMREEPYEGPTFSRATEAVEYCRSYVDGELRHYRKPGMSSDELLDMYRSFGEDPAIIALKPGLAPANFSSASYAAHRANAVVEEHGERSAN